MEPKELGTLSARVLIDIDPAKLARQALTQLGLFV